jgi:hypothetical protein
VPARADRLTDLARPAARRCLVSRRRRSRGRRATEDCFPAFGAAIEAFRRHLIADESQVLRHLEAVSQALIGATHELAGRAAERTG